MYCNNMNTDLYPEISRLIAARILNQPLTDKENEILEQWLSASEENRRCFDEIKTMETAAQLLRLQQNGYGEKMAERFKEQAYSNSFRRKSFYRHVYRFTAVAAVVLVLLCIGVGIYYYGNSESQQKQQRVASLIIPGDTKAVLKLADGHTMFINDQDKKQLNQIIDSANHVANTSSDIQIPLHTLSVPVGGEFQYNLADGTKVWLNSDTELRFPTTFSDKERHVYLTKGEAYFDVSKDKKRPFIVSTTQGNIKVYGTQFNVTNYENEQFSTVLVEGSIGFKPAKGKELRLEPSQRLTVDNDSQEIKVETVDTSLYTAWKQRMFVFKGQTLEEIMKILARWYDFTPVFSSDDIRNIRLSGRLYRYDDIRTLLDSYELTTGIHFSIDQKNIIISK